MPRESSQLNESGVAIVGVGLIGGSIAAALKARGYSGRILGFGRNPERLQQAQQLGLLDEFSVAVEPLIEQASLIVICTPVNRIIEDVRKFAAEAQPGTLITDTGSVKGEICTALQDYTAGEVEFIGSHPMAGSEKTGFEHARSDLFENRVCIVTPNEQHDQAATERTFRFWNYLGMRVERMSPALHDSAVAYSSHLPHIVAAALASSLPEEYRNCTGSGFRDSTRIAAGDPELWNSILTQNAGPIVEALLHFSEVLSEYVYLLESDRPAGLKNLLEQAKKNRDALDTTS